MRSIINLLVYIDNTRTLIYYLSIAKEVDLKKVSIQLDLDQYAAVKRLANLGNRSIARQLRLMLATAIDNGETEPTAEAMAKALANVRAEERNQS